MLAEQLISRDIIPLKTSDTGEEALSIMSDYYVRHLPIVNNEQLLGLLSEEDILSEDVHEPVGAYTLSVTRPYVRRDDHLYEVMRLMAEHELTLIPVVDEQNNYLGAITLADLLHYFARTTTFTEPGTILVLEVDRRDYSLAELARLIESEGAAILSVYLSSKPEASLLEVTIKVNTLDTRHIAATLERFNYQIKGRFGEAEYYDALQERYDALMNYLNI